jgi:large subunit ribosomal protein L1
MARLSKRMRLIKDRVLPSKSYSVEEAVKLLQALPPCKFIESVELSVKLGIDPRKSDQGVRGSVILPQGTGRAVRVAVFAQGAQATAAKEVGADLVGFEDLVESIQAGNLEFDVLIAVPEAMPLVGKLGPVLGPRGLMPNPRLGTVTTDITTAVNNAKSGQVHYRADKGGVVHGLIGKLSFQAAALNENLEAFLGALKKDKPAAAKGVYFKKITLSTTMGPGLLVDQSALNIAVLGA